MPWNSRVTTRLVLGAMIVGLGCRDASTGPSLARHASSLLRTELDSSPAHCAFLDCRSLSPEEKGQLLADADNARSLALLAWDVDCWEVFDRSLTKLQANQVYVMREGPSGVIGAANTQVSPFEVYIHEIRMATPTGRFNTLSHESIHTLRGPKPSAIETRTWEAEVQTRADGCDAYFVP